MVPSSWHSCCESSPFQLVNVEQTAAHPQTRLTRSYVDSASVGVADDLTVLITASKNMPPPVRAYSAADRKRALFTIGLISKHFDFADIVVDTIRVCILHGVGIIRSTSESRPNSIEGKNVRPSVRPSVHKKFLQFE